MIHYYYKYKLHMYVGMCMHTYVFISFLNESFDDLICVNLK